MIVSPLALRLRPLQHRLEVREKLAVAQAAHDAREQRHPPLALGEPRQFHHRLAHEHLVTEQPERAHRHQARHRAELGEHPLLDAGRARHARGIGRAEFDQDQQCVDKVVDLAIDEAGARDCAALVLKLADHLKVGFADLARAGERRPQREYRLGQLLAPLLVARFELPLRPAVAHQEGVTLGDMMRAVGRRAAMLADLADHLQHALLLAAEPRQRIGELPRGLHALLPLLGQLDQLRAVARRQLHVARHNGAARLARQPLARDPLEYGAPVAEPLQLRHDVALDRVDERRRQVQVHFLAERLDGFDAQSLERLLQVGDHLGRFGLLLVERQQPQELHPRGHALAVHQQFAHQFHAFTGPRDRHDPPPPAATAGARIAVEAPSRAGCPLALILSAAMRAGKRRFDRRRAPLDFHAAAVIISPPPLAAVPTPVEAPPAHGSHDPCR